MASDAHQSLQAWPACPVCAGDRRVSWVEHEDFAFVRCTCGLVYKSRDVPVEEAQPATLWNERYLRRRSHRVAKARRQLLDLLNHVEPGPLLEVGCSLGHTLEAARRLGLPATGIDLNPEVIELCREKGLDAQVADLDQPLPFANGSFRMVVLKHVLEHVPNPRPALAEVRRVLEPDGAVFIALPNLAFWRARSNPGHLFFGAGGVQHYVYYKPDHAARLVREEGFEVLRLDPHLYQRSAPLGERVAQIAALPLRALGSHLRSRLGLRQEFWLIARRISFVDRHLD